MNKPLLSPADFVRAALSLGCTSPTIQAVCAVEAPLGGFQSDGTPTILFERHKFREFTGHQFDRVAPDLSAPTAGGYGRYSEQNDRFARASKLDRTAALRATSWGKFQIMGFNHEQAGHATLQAFVNAMYAGESEQLQAFVDFVRNDRRRHPETGRTMVQALIARDWASFSYLYNGKNYAINQHDVKLAAAHRALTA